jgi:putative kinase
MDAIMLALLCIRKEGQYLAGTMEEGKTKRPDPDAWRSRTAALAGEVTLDLAGQTTTVELSLEALERVYLPLLAMLDAHCRGGRVLAGLAGVPGGGKSTVGAILQHVADELWEPHRLVLVAMDGWHYPNVVLDRLTTQGADGRTVPLRQRKGGPESYDVPALAESLQRLRSADAVCRLPVYSRKLHDPVADAVEVPVDARIVLVEGNFLLSADPPWDAVSRLLDIKCFLLADLDEARRRVLARHVRGGSTQEQAEAKYEANDRLNTEAVLATRCQADVVIQLNGPGMGVRIRGGS